MTFANMKENQTNVQKEKKRFLGHLEGMLNFFLCFFLKGPQIFALIIFGFPTGPTFRVSVFFSKVCFFIGTSEAVEVILGW